MSRDRKAAQEGRELGIFYPGREGLEHVVSQGLGAGSMEEKRLIHRDSEEAGSVCLGVVREGADSGQIHSLPRSTMVTDVRSEGPRASQVSEVPFRSPFL